MTDSIGASPAQTNVALWLAAESQDAAAVAAEGHLPDPVLEIAGLAQRLEDPERREQFVVRSSQPIVIRRGDLVAVVGPSGCGKTTLLTVLGLLRSPTNVAGLERFLIRTSSANGQTVIHDLKQLWSKRRLRLIEGLRRRHIGFAFQSGELLPALTVWENIAAPLHFNGVTGWPCRQRVDELLRAFRLGDGEGGAGNGRPTSRLSHSRVNKLSGGEYQRAALARAIVHSPTLVFVDEPTAALNRELAWGALSELRALQRREQASGATVMVTHDEQLAAAFANMIIRMAPLKSQPPAGEVVEITRRHPDPAGAPLHRGEVVP